jgi:hypothetical protein
LKNASRLASVVILRPKNFSFNLRSKRTPTSPFCQSIIGYPSHIGMLIAKILMFRGLAQILCRMKDKYWGNMGLH